MSQFKTVLFGAQFFTFTTKGGAALELHGQLLGWTDKAAIRIANHEYLKRDGGECEPMGAAQERYSFRCCYIGPDLSILYRNVKATVKKEPRGQLVHPRLGKIDVACEGVHASENPEAAIDYLDFTIDFVENAVDTTVTQEIDIGPSMRARQVRDAISLATSAVSTIISERIANTIYAAATTAVADFTTTIDRFRQDAEETANSSTPNLSLGTLLGRCAEKRDAAIVAVNKVITKTLQSDVSLVPARHAIYIAYAAAVQLYNAVLAQRPPVVQFIVPSPMPLTTVALRIYGAEASSKIDEIQQLNRIPFPYWIPAGTVLQVVAPVVRQ